MTEPSPSEQASPRWGPRGERRGPDAGALIFGLLLVAIGGYFLLTETLGYDLPDIGQFWPVFVILLGVWILASAARRDRL